MQIESGPFQSLGEIDAPRYETNPSILRASNSNRSISRFVLDRELENGRTTRIIGK